MRLERQQFVVWIICAVLFNGAGTRDALAQSGDRAGEVQPSIPHEWMTHDSPVLSPAESLACLHVADGYRVELVASEPLIHAPIAAVFAPDGAMWVLEMPGFMTDPAGSRELEPSGRVVVLRDHDGDGRMDKATVFLDHLVLPRALALWNDGLLVIEPPNLIFARDTNNDGRADHTRVLAAGFEGIASPEHAGNGLLWQSDGTWAFSQHGARMRLSANSSVVGLERTPLHGQWGLTHDDWGRLYYSLNSDALLCDLLPKTFSAQSVTAPPIPAVASRVVTDQRVWPTHLTPGVNRGYQPNILKDGRLREFTAGCGPLIYRDDVLGADVKGDAFVCEPAANLVMRYQVSEDQDGLHGTPADGDRAFLSSVDERFRPVNLLAGPDGALYVIDMSRGILQHRLFMTTFLRQQVEARQLVQGNECGRIWRVVPKARPLRSASDLSKATPLDLAEQISSPSGAIRDMAQRLLVERADPSTSNPIAAALRQSCESDRPEVRRLALWTLALIGNLTTEDTLRASRDAHARVREASALVLDGQIRSGTIERNIAEATLLTLARDEDRLVRLHAAAALSGLLDDPLTSQTAASRTQLFDAITEDLFDRSFRSLIVQASNNQQVPLIHLLAARETLEQGTILLIEDLLESALLSGREDIAAAAFEMMVAMPLRNPALAGTLMERTAVVLRAREIKPSARMSIRIASQPSTWFLTIRGNDDFSRAALLVDRCLLWPGRTGYERAAAAPLSQMARGRMLYANCSGCHGASGEGTAGVYPPLRASPFVTGDPERLALILLHGLEGRLERGGHVYLAHMPPAPIDGDENLAALMSFLRSSWGNDASAVDATWVKSIRNTHTQRVTPWTVGELADLSTLAYP
ncbi:MAG: hypothetical protein O2800_01480 [Planctomycetota bacterium]|nr:hypothetical protein [Planctomycetota bacterium]